MSGRLWKTRRISGGRGATNSPLTAPPPRAPSKLRRRIIDHQSSGLAGEAEHPGRLSTRMTGGTRKLSVDGALKEEKDTPAMRLQEKN